MAKRTPLGEFEAFVLLAILRHANGVVGSDIGRELEARANRRVSRGALYATLSRLETKGLLSWKVEASGPDRGGHAPRIFTVTRDGKAAIREFGRAVRALASGTVDLL
jgi:PadR family transcriptional regulator PadR